MLKIVLICIDTWLQDLVIIFKKILFLLNNLGHSVCMSFWKTMLYKIFSYCFLVIQSFKFQHLYESIIKIIMLIFIN